MEIDPENAVTEQNCQFQSHSTFGVQIIQLSSHGESGEQSELILQTSI